MKYLTFENGDQMPILGLGTWKSDKGEVYKTVRKAIEIGYRHFDCAFVYQNEKEIGTALSDAIKAGDVTRPDLWITSKLWNSSHKKEDVKLAIDQTLSDLNLEYLDLYLIHWPLAQKKDTIFPREAADFVSLEQAPILETWTAMEDLLDLKLTRHIGVANFGIEKLTSLKKMAKYQPEVNQIEHHIVLQQTALIDYCKSEKIHVTAYSPLGSPGRNNKSNLEPVMFELPAVIQTADAHQCTAAQILLAWHVNRGISPIPKTVDPNRLKENLLAAEIVLSPKELQSLAKLDLNFRFIDGKLWFIPGSTYHSEDFWN